MVAVLHDNENALRELVAHPSVDLDILDNDGRGLEELARWVDDQSINQID